MIRTKRRIYKRISEPPQDTLTLSDTLLYLELANELSVNLKMVLTKRLRVDIKKKLFF